MLDFAPEDDGMPFVDLEFFSANDLSLDFHLSPAGTAVSHRSGGQLQMPRNRKTVVFSS